MCRCFCLVLVVLCLCVNGFLFSFTDNTVDSVRHAIPDYSTLLVSAGAMHHHPPAAADDDGENSKMHEDLFFLSFSYQSANN